MSGETSGIFGAIVGGSESVILLVGDFTMEPFKGFGVYSLDRNRLVLPRGIEIYVPWLVSKESIDCLGVPGPAGGLMVFSPQALKEHRAMTAYLQQGEDLTPDQMGTAIFELTRYAMVALEITIGPDRRFTLPLAARDLGIVPVRPNDPVGLVASRGRMEVWRVSELLVQVQSSAGNRAELEMRAGLPRE